MKSYSLIIYRECYVEPNAEYFMVPDNIISEELRTLLEYAHSIGLFKDYQWQQMNHEQELAFLSISSYVDPNLGRIHKQATEEEKSVLHTGEWLRYKIEENTKGHCHIITHIYQWSFGI